MGYQTPDNELRNMDSDQYKILKTDRTSFGADEIRHRFGYHKPAGEAVTEMHRTTRGVLMDVAQIFDRMLPEGRAKSVAIQHLEEACMWANKAIAEMSPVVDE